MADTCRASQKLIDFLENPANGMTRQKLADALGVTEASVSYWLSSNEKKRPRAWHREGIEVITRGAVKASDWTTDKEARLLRRLEKQFGAVRAA